MRAVVEWLSRTQHWLLVLDNVDDRREVRRFVPEQPRGHVLITSRESVFAELGVPRALEVENLSTDAAIEFLLKRTGRDGDAADWGAAGDLAEQLGNLPLALEQAAAYIAWTNASFPDYLAAFRRRRVTLLEKAVGLVSHDTVAVTWAANFEAVERASPAAADVLRISAFIGPEAIPFDLFLKGAQMLGPSIAEALSDPDELAVSELLRPLARYSLIKSDATSRSFNVHRLVQEVVRSAIDESHRPVLVDWAVGAFAATLHTLEYAAWPRFEQLVPHVMAVGESVDSYNLYPAGWSRISNDASCYLRERGRYAEAEESSCRMLSIAERVLGPPHVDVATCLNALGIIYQYRGRYDEVQSLHERALAIREHELGRDDLLVANSLNNLANVHEDSGRYAEAQALHERALAISEHLPNPDDTHLALMLGNLASSHLEQGNYAQAESLFARSLAANERALGADHPDLAYGLVGLGRVQTLLGQCHVAEPLFDRALALRERALGREHPEVAFTLTNAAEKSCRCGPFSEAEPFLERAIAIYERVYGPDHPNLARPLASLASVREVQGRTPDAIELFERAHAIFEHRLAADDPDCVQVRARLDSLRATQRAAQS